MIRYDTLGKLIDANYQIAVYCENHPVCHHGAWLDLPALAERLGRDHGCMHDDIVPWMRCSKCGSKNVSIRLHPPTTREERDRAAATAPRS